MTNAKAAGFTKVKSDSATEQDLDISPLTVALNKRRQDMANKRQAQIDQADTDQPTDALGNKIPDSSS
jgi:hypothetical protein